VTSRHSRDVIIPSEPITDRLLITAIHTLVSSVIDVVWPVARPFDVKGRFTTAAST